MIGETVLRNSLFMAVLVACLFLVVPRSASAETGTEFPGTVVSVEAAAGKLAVKKEGGGTRFTFVVNDKTQFEGMKTIADVKKGDSVTVTYAVVGSQYIAQKITKK